MIILPEHYKFNKPHVSGFECIESSQEIDPRGYLQFSQTDLEASNDARSNINALTNAKRALHYQVELLVNAFGIKSLPKKERQHFPEKLEFCKKCSLTTPQILRRMNSMRNLVEHEYIVPERAEAEDFVDVVDLFISATDPFLNMFPSELEWFSCEKTKNDLPDIQNILYPPYEGVIYLRPTKKQMESIDPDMFKSSPDAPMSAEDFLQRWLKNSYKIRITDDEPYYKWVHLIIESCPY